MMVDVLNDHTRGMHELVKDALERRPSRKRAPAVSEGDSESNSDGEVRGGTVGRDAEAGNTGEVRGGRPPAHQHLKMPKPALFTGLDKHEPVEEVIFTFEGYFEGMGVPQAQWPQMVLTLLGGKAKDAWLAVAMPAKTRGEKLPWSRVVDCMHKAFAHPDRQHAARMQLFKVKQDHTACCEALLHARDECG